MRQNRSNNQTQSLEEKIITSISRRGRVMLLLFALCEIGEGYLTPEQSAHVRKLIKAVPFENITH